MKIIRSTSRAGYEDVQKYRASSQKARILKAHEDARRSGGLTDEEAAEICGLLHTCYWARCNELREDGMIEEVPGETRVGRAGLQRMVCRITEDGRDEVRRYG